MIISCYLSIAVRVMIIKIGDYDDAYFDYYYEPQYNVQIVKSRRTPVRY